MVKKVAPAPTTVLLTGESGVGKEVVASMIHANSPSEGQCLSASELQRDSGESSRKPVVRSHEGFIYPCRRISGGAFPESPSRYDLSGRNRRNAFEPAAEIVARSGGEDGSAGGLHDSGEG
jgi:hypothetical protein